MSTTTVLPFAGGELSSFDPQDSGCFESTTAGRFNPTYARCAIEVGGNSGGFKSPLWTAASEFWFHCDVFPQSDNSGAVIRFFNGATVVLEVDASPGYTYVVKSLQSSVLTTVGTLALFSGPTGAYNTIDIRVVAGASGIVEGYISGTLIFRTTGLNHTDFSGVTQIQCLGQSSAFPSYWSQIICDTISHVGDALVTLAEDTASAVNTDWFGPVTNINEIVLTDANSVTSSAANQISTYYKAGASLGTYNIVGVFVGVRAQKTAGSSTNLQVCLRTNGSNYFSPTIALDFGFQACCASWTTNPFTGLAWAPSSAAIIEAGMKSIA